MSDVLYFESGTSLEQRFKLVCSKIQYYFVKIASYDSVLNEFNILKNSIENIIKESEESCELARNLSRSMLIQHDELHQLNQRVTSESLRYDAIAKGIAESVLFVKENLEYRAVEQSNKIESLKKEFLKRLEDYPTTKDLAVIFYAVQEKTENIKDQLEIFSRDLRSLEDVTVHIHDAIQRIQEKQDTQYKDICILQNAMVRLRAEVIK